MPCRALTPPPAHTPLPSTHVWQVFREAKIHDAILFFDECESIFMDRTKGNLQVNTVLTELERHEGLCILATNRPMDLDEAMHRRITLAIEFTKPDLLLRERIWRSMAPPKLPLADDVDFMLLARKCAPTPAARPCPCP